MKTQLLRYISPIFIFLFLLGNRTTGQTITVAALNSGLSPDPISLGNNGYVLFGFSVTYSSAATASILQITTVGGVNSQSMFSNGKLYRANSASTTSYSSIGFTQVSGTGSGGTTNIYSNAVQFTGLNETFAAGETKNYFFVADFTVTYFTATSIQFTINKSQSDAFAIGPSYSYQKNSTNTITGPLYHVGATLNWRGGANGNANFSDPANYSTANGNAPSVAPGQYDVVQIGVVDRYNATMPTVTGNKTIGKLVFGSNYVPTLTISAGGSLTANLGMTINAGASPIIASSSTSSVATLNVAGTSTVASTGAIQLSNKITIANTGSFTFLSDASGTGSVRALPSTASLTGTYTVQRWFTGGHPSDRGWRLMSSPVANGSGTYNFSSLQTNLYITGALGGGFDVSPANNATVLLYDTPNKKLISLPSITTGVSVGSGFYFYFRGDKITTLGKLAKNGANYATPETNVVGLQTGTLNQQGITYTLSNAGSGFNLVGNPYASTISMPSGGGAVGNSAPYTGTTGFVYTYTPGANSVSAAVSTVNIASGQGFYVKSNSATSSIAFTESLKATAQVTGSNLLLGKPVGTEQPLITIKMVQDSANYDIAYVRFLDTYKNEYDENEDADDINGSGQNVFLSAMTIDNHAVAVASQPLDKKKTSVFLTVNDNFSGLYTIQKMNLSGIPEVYDIWLMDHFKNDSLDLRANDTYKFNLDKANPLTYGSTRFEIVLRKKALPPYALVSFNGQKTGTDVLLKWNTVNEYDYTSFELQRSSDGTNFETVRNIQSSSQGSYNFKDIYSSNNTATIYYRLKQVDINDMVYYSNIVIITPAKGNGTFAVFPNPATNTIQFTLDQTIKSSSVRLNIFNAMGLLMKSNVFTASTGQQDVSNLTPGNYTIEVTDLNSKKAVLTGKFIKL
ncbi:T9SS type A sorting domain-containing protein [Mucilaginibacter rigui]|uniref:T9SS type A sorting domain-containing protein n=1 Tax=Mucilaginibacter rigui TaxID=534635 RepID=A0ABR7WZK6_9SPHI|nr:T9SS type A sorting domain-containing protein [Mucilaginibacter rigui]MBD1383771.1 T9SS type A sorting domain-containing protein [Mucilaginibacter rigui]